MSSIQEREAELAALQSAFDEYITSSRELEEELDAELAKMRKCFGMWVVSLCAPINVYLCWWMWACGCREGEGQVSATSILHQGLLLCDVGCPCYGCLV
jgi:hypothetical protein